MRQKDKYQVLKQSEKTQRENNLLTPSALFIIYIKVYVKFIESFLKQSKSKKKYREND